MGRQSYMATVFVGEREIGEPFVNGDFRSSLNFARRELREYFHVAEGIYRYEIVSYYDRGYKLPPESAPVLEFGILTETKELICKFIRTRWFCSRTQPDASG